MGKKGEAGEAAMPSKAATPSPAKASPSPAKAALLPVKAAPLPAKAAPLPAKAAAAAGQVVDELPRAIVRRVVKDKLNQLCSSSSKGGEGDEEVSVNKDGLLAFSESARIFIHYLSATANDICMESKRQTVNAEDVLKALEEIEFPEFVEPLKVSLEEFRRKNAVKKTTAKGKENDKKRKLEEPELTTQNGEDGGAADEEEGMEDQDEADPILIQDDDH